MFGRWWWIVRSIRWHRSIAWWMLALWQWRLIWHNDWWFCRHWHRWRLCWWQCWQITGQSFNQFLNVGKLTWFRITSDIFHSIRRLNYDIIEDNYIRFRPGHLSVRERKCEKSHKKKRIWPMVSPHWWSLQGPYTIFDLPDWRQPILQQPNASFVQHYSVLECSTMEWKKK